MGTDSQDWQRLGAYFDELVELAPEQQREKLAALDLSDEDRSEIEQLLEADRADAGPLERGGEIIGQWSDSGDGGDPATGPESMVGRRVGRWILEEPLGQGGSAVVFRARREDGFDQVAALKLLTLGSLASRRHRFFDRERQFLARLKHPHIATLLDGGVTEDGTPFLVTQLVNGAPLDEYCESPPSSPRPDGAGLDLDARLDLFLDICDTVAFAHRQLVVHRDLKPSNILVDEEGHIHLLDFGIAKLLDDAENATGTVAAFTPAYAAPEQWFGEPASTATDVYSLGLILYQLCTGEPLPEKDGPSRRSSPGRASAGAGFPRVEDVTVSFPKDQSSKNQRRLDRDLQAIVELTLRLDAAQRYPDARALAEDLRRWRSGHPTLARPTGQIERAGKFLRRNPIASAASALALAALIALAVISTWQGRRVAEQRDIARAEADKAQQTVDLLRDFLASADPEVHGRDLKVLELLEAFEPRLESIDDAVIRANLLHTYGTTYESLGDLEDARRFMEQALELRAAVLGDRHEETLLASTDLSIILFSAGELEAAENLARKTLDAAQQSLGPEHPVTLDALDNLAATLRRRGQHEDAVDLHSQALETRERLFGPDHEGTVTSKNGLAIGLIQLGRAAEAEPLLAEALEQNRQAFGEDHPRTLTAMNNLAYARGSSGDFKGAVPIFRELSKRLEATLGTDHPNTMSSLSNLAVVLNRNGDSEEGLSILKTLAERQTAKLGEHHPHTLSTQQIIASTWRQVGQAEQAAALAAEIIEARRQALGPADPETLSAIGERAQALMALGRGEEAAELIRQALEDSAGTESRNREGLAHILTLIETPDAETD